MIIPLRSCLSISAWTDLFVCTEESSKQPDAWNAFRTFGLVVTTLQQA